jgi:predicted nucleic acid-binding protein
MPAEAAKAFFDTNVLVYVASADQAKADRAESLLAEGGVISVQVLNELANVARRKLALSWPETVAFLALVRGLVEVRPVTVEVHALGLTLAERFRLSVYDAMIVASALDAGCGVLWSEDMRDGLLIDGALAITNPFAAKS